MSTYPTYNPYPGYSPYPTSSQVSGQGTSIYGQQTSSPLPQSYNPYAPFNMEGTINSPFVNGRTYITGGGAAGASHNGAYAAVNFAPGYTPYVPFHLQNYPPELLAGFGQAYGGGNPLAGSSGSSPNSFMGGTSPFGGNTPLNGANPADPMASMFNSPLFGPASPYNVPGTAQHFSHFGPGYANGGGLVSDGISNLFMQGAGSNVNPYLNQAKTVSSTSYGTYVANVGYPGGEAFADYWGSYAMGMGAHAQRWTPFGVLVDAAGPSYNLGNYGPFGAA